jgi:tetratricopeptide (TPR) repeat protein
MKTAFVFFLTAALCLGAVRAGAAPAVTIEEADKMLEEGRFDDAIAAFERIASGLRPNDQRTGTVMRALGVGYANLGENEKAIRAFLQSLEAEPRSVMTRVYLGTCYRLEDRTLEAIPAFLGALQLDPDLERAHDELWQSYGVLGDRYGYDAELAAREMYHLGKLLAIDPGYSAQFPRALEELKYLRAVKARFEAGETGRIYRDMAVPPAEGAVLALPDDGVSPEERKAEIEKAEKL